MKVIVVGGGFGGITAARELHKRTKADVTLISDNDCFCYHPALYRNSTGRSHLEIAIPLAKILKPPIKLIKDHLERLDAESHSLTGRSGRTYRYDILVLALGSVSEYYGIRDLEDYAFGIKSSAQADSLKQHLHTQLTGQKNGPELNCVVVGGGPTGVELAGEVVFYLQKIKQRHDTSRRFNVQLVEAAPRLLPALPEDVSRLAETRLKELSVKIFTSTAVRAKTASGLKLPEGTIKNQTVIWTAGVTNNPFFAQNSSQFKWGKAGHVKVSSRLEAAPNVYVISGSVTSGQSGLAQSDVYDATFVAKHIHGDKVDYAPPKTVTAIPIGPKWCLISQEHRRLHGYPGWLVRRWLDLQLFSSVLPVWPALKIWFFGTRRAESCPVCR